MNPIRKWINYSRQLYRGETEPRNTLGYILLHYIKVCFVFLNKDDSKKSTLCGNFFHVSLVFFVTLHFVFMMLHMIRTPITKENLVSVCNYLGLLLGASNSCCVMIINLWKCNKLTAIVQAINKKVILARANATQELSSERIYAHLVLSWFIIIGIIMGCVFTIVIFFYSCITGVQYIVLWDSPQYSWSWWTSVVYTEVSCFYCFFHFSFCDNQVLDCIIQLAFLYRVEYNKFKYISTTDERLARDQLVEIYKELVALKELTTYFMNTIWWTKFYFWSISYLSLSTSCVALAVAVGQGYFAIAQVLVYPMFVIGVMTIWGLVSSHFEESVSRSQKVFILRPLNHQSDLQAAQGNLEIYCSNWTAMSPQTRKIFIFLMIFGQNSPRLVVKPFYVQNRALIAEVPWKYANDFIS